MVTEYGMTERLGAIKLGDNSSEPFLGRDMGHQRNYSEDVAAMVDEETKTLLTNAHQEAFDILVENRDVLDSLVIELLEKETLDKAQIAEVFVPLRRRPARPAWTGSPSREPSDIPPVVVPKAASNGTRPGAGDRRGPDAPGRRRATCTASPTSAARTERPADMAVDRISQEPRPDIPDFDRPRAEAAVRELLIAVGEDPDREGLLETPARVARAYQELLGGMRLAAEDVLTTTFDAGHDEMILVKNIELWSMCEHHLVPFTGVAHIGYIPSENGRITGLSKLARLVDVYAKRPQVQERLTTQVADAMMSILEARGAIVVIEAEHLCMTMRGVHKPGSKTVTSAVRGTMHQAATRAEAMSLIMSPSR